MPASLSVPPAFFIAARSRSKSRSWLLFTRGGFPSWRYVEHLGMVKIAAAGDVHASEATRSRIVEAFAAVVRELQGQEVGVVGTKGFVGGFSGSQLPDFGEPLLRRVYVETTEEVEAIRQGLQ